MRHLTAAIAIVLVACSAATADVTDVRIGDVPRTGTHYTNAREAALCGAAAGTGGISSIYLNPAVAVPEDGAEGLAAFRFNVKSRAYLPEGDVGLDATDDGLLLSQAAAIKTSGAWTFGFGYATPAYRDLELTGKIETDDRRVEPYDGDFTGSLRTFEAVLSTRIGSRGQGVIGASAGVATIDETGRVVVGSDLDESWGIDGLGATYAIGFLFQATERVAVGIGYRFGSEIDVESSGVGLEGASGTFRTAPVASGGVTVRPIDRLALHASVVRQGWHRAEVQLDVQDAEDIIAAPAISDPLLTVALGAEYDLTDRFTLRGGYAMQTTDGIEGAAVPENAFGIGATYAWTQYYMDAAYVHESFELDGESGEVTNNGIYVSGGYRF